MKLSFKFFCIAYLAVLLSTGLAGSYIVYTINHMLWDAQIERVNAAVAYAADSFMAFADISDREISASQRADATRQIKHMLDDVISDLDILPSEAVSAKHLAMQENACAATYIKNDQRLLMESVCKLNTGSAEYYLFLYSDFTKIQQQHDTLWNTYGLVVICVSIGSGLLLFALTKRVTTPLRKLATVADEIALGNYGKTVKLTHAGHEITALSSSVNSMSHAIAQKIHEIQDELEKRDLFVADFTHEMKTPMTAIIGYAQLLRSYDLDKSEKDQASEAICNEAKRLEKLSLQLLELYVYRNESIQTENLDLFEVGEQLHSTLRFLSEKYRVDYHIDFHHATVSANREMLLTLLYNLADNAFKASRPQTSIRIYSQTDATSVTIHIEDHGIGIAKEHLKWITEPFYREDKSRSRESGGAGLGLALCKEIAILHATQLHFESEKEKGTTVSFSLKKGGVEK
ncbi:MAG: HAMP domain-containing histidine kinase [Clostridia bacterium]|nr:HAMP domain-containing histidine kinase [Clostridia bacterium]